MVSINLYTPPVFDFELEFPSSWNELLPVEIPFISRQLLLQSDGAVVRGPILKYLIDSRAALADKELPKDWFLKIDAEQFVIDVYPLADFIFNDNNLTNTPLAIEMQGRTLHPQLFENITCAEFEDCEVLAMRFAEEPSPELLANLSAILFRIKTIGGVEPYMKLNPVTAQYVTYATEKKIVPFLKLPPEQLYAHFIWYSGCRAQLPLMFPGVYDGGTPGQLDLMAFTKCIHSGAGQKNGSREKIRTMKLYEFMFEMELEAQRAAEQEAQYEAMKNK